MKKKIVAVIGSGISGLSISMLLSKNYDVHLFEKNDYLGGHTRTISIEEKESSYNIDTGFIVFNEKNYPDLINFFDFLKIDIENSDMSFSVSLHHPEFEYSSKINSMFYHRNIFSIRYWILMKDIIRLYKHCKRTSKLKNFENYTLEDFLNNFNYSETIKNLHIYPIVSSIWSCSKVDVKKFPLISFINFFSNHELFNFTNRPQWFFVKGGSVKYIDSIISKKLFNYKINKCVKKVYRNQDKITIVFNDNEKFMTDKIVLATHADQSLKLLDNPTIEEKEILSKFRYSTNHTYLHSDYKFMPKKKTMWSSWNFIGQVENDRSFSLTYWMNLLQNLKSKKNYFVSINPYKTPENYYDSTIFQHPIFDLETLSAQKKLYKIQGVQNTFYCGSYCGYGFHEDGIQSSAYVANLLKAELLWSRKSNFINRLQFV